MPPLNVQRQTTPPTAPSGFARDAKPEQRHPVTIDEHPIGGDHLCAGRQPLRGVDPQIVVGGSRVGGLPRGLVAVVG